MWNIFFLIKLKSIFILSEFFGKKGFRLREVFFPECGIYSFLIKLKSIFILANFSEKKASVFGKFFFFFS